MLPLALGVLLVLIFFVVGDVFVFVHIGLGLGVVVVVIGVCLRVRLFW